MQCGEWIQIDSIGDIYCHGGTYNTAECGFDGGDCEDFNLEYPGYNAEDIRKIGNGYCYGGTNNTTVLYCPLLWQTPSPILPGQATLPAIWVQFQFPKWQTISSVKPTIFGIITIFIIVTSSIVNQSRNVHITIGILLVEFLTIPTIVITTSIVVIPCSITLLAACRLEARMEKGICTQKHQHR